MRVTLNCITQPLLSIHTGANNTTPMKPEEYMIYCARVSSENRVNNETAPKLLNYLIEHKHWSPFEMISIGIEIKTSRAIAQQILRHRSFSFQEFSQRYAEVTDMEPVELRYKAKTNRQSSVEEIDPEDKDNYLNEMVSGHVRDCQRFYKILLESGIATECARMVLPLTTQTTIVMHGTLRSWIHFFEQRCSEHAQLEIQEIAYAARNEIAKVCPWTAKALNW
jgi:thymidylate synthase (FAD)